MSAAPSATPPRPERAPIRFTSIPVASRISERTRRRGEALAPWMFMATNASAMIIAAFRVPQAFPILASLGLTAFILTFLSRTGDDPAPTATPSTVEAFDWGVRVIGADGTTTSILREELESGRIAPVGRLVLRRRDGVEWVIDLPTQGARDVLERLGLSSAQRAAKVPIGGAWSRALASIGRVLGTTPATRQLQSTVSGIMVPLFIGLLGMGAGSAYWDGMHGQGALSLVAAAVIAIATTTAMWGFHRLRRRGAATIGADGILLHGVLGARFIPWTDVASISELTHRDVIELALRDGKTELLVTAPGGDDLIDRLRAGKAASEATSTISPFAALERGSRDRSEWMEHLRGLGRSEGYRESRLQSDQLAEVVGDARARPEHRVAAAVVLAGQIGEPEDPSRQRVRIAIDTCADPDLKVALERAAEGEIAEEELAIAERRARQE
jgi:hypothetical protein